MYFFPLPFNPLVLPLTPSNLPTAVHVHSPFSFIRAQSFQPLFFIVLFYITSCHPYTLFHLHHSLLQSPDCCSCSWVLFLFFLIPLPFPSRVASLFSVSIQSRRHGFCLFSCSHSWSWWLVIGMYITSHSTASRFCWSWCPSRLQRKFPIFTCLWPSCFRNCTRKMICGSTDFPEPE